MGTVQVREPGVPGEFEIEAPAVLLEVCGAFVAGQDEAGICAQCGWLEDDHVVAATGYEAAPAEVAA